MRCLVLIFNIFYFIYNASSQTVSGVGPQCCNLAKSTGAFLDKSIAPEDYVCGQKYEENSSPAPVLRVGLGWCMKNCPGHVVFDPSDTDAWALPLVQFILAAVIFSMTIPRRLGFELPQLSRLARTFGISHPLLSWLFLPLLHVTYTLLLTFDIAIWVFTVMLAAAPFILSGLYEVILDFRVTRYIKMQSFDSGIERNEITELMIATLAGNLAIEGVPANARTELLEKFDTSKRGADAIEKNAVRLREMVKCQTPFGTSVGAPVLLFVGSFIYSLVELDGTTGDKDTARALAFGIWWMTIVNVTAISGSLLASNSPSTAAAVVGRARERPSTAQRYKYASMREQMEDRVQAYLETFSRIPLAYSARFEPVWMWSRGSNKAQWLHKSARWERREFRDRVNLSASGWVLLTSTSYFLILVPSGLAFWIEYNTPDVGFGCRAVTIFVYGAAQVVFVVLSGWSHFKAAQGVEYWKRHTLLNKMRNRTLGIATFVILFFAWFSAVFTTFGGTLMQVTGIYQNCICAATFGQIKTVSLASDTQADRDSSDSWAASGYAALGFLVLVTYIGWWMQRYLHDLFLEQVDRLFECGKCQHGNDLYLNENAAAMKQPSMAEKTIKCQADLENGNEDIGIHGENTIVGR